MDFCLQSLDSKGLGAIQGIWAELRCLFRGEWTFGMGGHPPNVGIVLVFAGFWGEAPCEDSR